MAALPARRTARFVGLLFGVTALAVTVITLFPGLY